MNYPELLRTLSTASASLASSSVMSFTIFPCSSLSIIFFKKSKLSKSSISSLRYRHIYHVSVPSSPMELRNSFLSCSFTFFEVFSTFATLILGDVHPSPLGKRRIPHPQSFCCLYVFFQLYFNAFEKFFNQFRPDFRPLSAFSTWKASCRFFSLSLIKLTVVSRMISCVMLYSPRFQVQYAPEFRIGF